MSPPNAENSKGRILKPARQKWHSRYRRARTLESPAAGRLTSGRYFSACRFCALTLLVLLMAGCATLKDPETSQDNAGEVVARVKPGNAVGQSLVSRRAAFNSIQLWLRAASAPAEAFPALTVELYRTLGEANPLASVSIPFDDLKDFPVTITFPAQKDPPRQVYYLNLKAEGGEVDVYGRSEDVYPYGTLILDGQAQDADIAFRGAYDYGAPALIEDMRRAAGDAWLIIPLLLILWVPGRLTLWPIIKRQDLDWGQRTALSIGMSLAIAPVVTLWTTTLDLHWSRTGVWIIYGIAAAALAWIFWRGRIDPPRLKLDAPDLALIGILIFSFGLRMVMIRDLAGPPWVDPVHHSLITRLIVEQGGLPETFQNPAEAESAHYHPGFHVTVAAFHQLSGLEIADAMLLFGQVQNALSVLAVYLLAATLTRDRATGLFAALITGAFFPMPAYYLSWGRYTQLAGLLILPAAIALIEETLKQPWPVKRGALLAASAVCAGLFLTHYRVAVFLALWLAAYLLAETLRSLDRRAIWSSMANLGGHILAVGAIAIILSLPWWPELWQGMVAPHLAAKPTPVPLKIDWGYFNPVYGRPILWLALLGLLVSILRLAWFGPTLVLWFGLMFMSANQGSLSLPLAGAVDKTSVEISLFVPVSILAGYLISSLFQTIQRWSPGRLWPAIAGITALAAAGLSLYAAPKMLNLLNPNTLLLRQADRTALAWVENNLPQKATALINPFLWGYGAYAGQDGGYWISPITGRQTMPPTVLYNMGDQALIDQVTLASRTAIDSGKDPQKLYEMLQSQGIDYVYIGRRGGVLSPRALRESGLFRTIYHRDGVWVFERSAIPGGENP